MPARAAAEAEESAVNISRAGSSAPLLMNAPSLQPQVFGALLEQARQVSGKLIGPSFHSLEIESEPSNGAEPNKSWDNPPSSSRRSQSWGGDPASPVHSITNGNPRTSDFSSLSTKKVIKTAAHTMCWSQEAPSKADGLSNPSQRPPRPRLPVSSQASSRCNSPRGNGDASTAAPSSSSSSQPPRHSKISKSSSTSNIVFNAGLNTDAVTQSLCSKSTDEQIWALKKLRFDLELCRCLANEER